MKEKNYLTENKKILKLLTRIGSMKRHFQKMNHYMSNFKDRVLKLKKLKENQKKFMSKGEQVIYYESLIQSFKKDSESLFKNIIFQINKGLILPIDSREDLKKELEMKHKEYISERKRQEEISSEFKTARELEVVGCGEENKLE